MSHLPSLASWKWCVGSAALLVLAVASARGQEKPPADTEPLSLLKDRKAAKYFDAAADFIAEKNWANAVTVLQTVLQRSEDTFFTQTVKDEKGRAIQQQSSARVAAMRILDALPAEGRAEYQKQFATKASDRLADAKMGKDPEALRKVIRIYRRTPAGIEAAELLGLHYSKQGLPELAARCLDAVLEGAWGPVPETALYRSAQFQRQLGRLDRAAALEKQLFARIGKDGLRIDGAALTIEQLRKELNAVKGREATVGDWLMFGGSPARTAVGQGDVPFLDEDAGRWNHSTVHQEQTRAWIDLAVKFQESRQQAPVLPALFPIAAHIAIDVKGRTERKGLVVYRSYWGVHAADASTGKLFWEQDADYSVDNLVNPQRAAGRLVQLNTWMPMYQVGGNMNLIYENSLLGTLSTDGSLVYFIDDLALPPHPQFLQQFMWGGQPQFGGALAGALNHNRLIAVALDRGKRMWQAGGIGEKGGELSDTFFLGAPLALDGRLYVLTEKGSELAVVCLEAASGKRLWRQPLANVRDPLSRDLGRRMQSVNLAYADGVLVCPTNVGTVFGIDLLTRSLLWAHPYRRTGPAVGGDGKPVRRWQGPLALFGSSLTPDWHYCTPCIHKDRVLFTAPDGEGVFCLNLRDGTLVWQAARRDDVYLAGIFNDRALLVGKSSCRALAVADGKEVWKLETGVPSGLGVATGSTYLLPLKSGATSKLPEVCVLDIAKGTIHSHVRSRRKEVPGNLLLYEGRVISQTVRDITSYPQLKAKLAMINQLIAKNPKDPAGLIERAELRRSNGDLADSAADLRLALAAKPPEALVLRARQLLFEVLTDLFQRDFAGSEKYLDEFRDVSTIQIPKDADPAGRKQLEEERRRRLADFLYLVGKGREQQVNYLEAFKHYEQLAQLGEGLLTVTDEPAVQARADVWAAGRIAGMLARATPEKRKGLEEEIARRWQAVRKAGKLDEVRNFAAVLGSVPSIGKEVRLELANRLIEQRAYAEAELVLLQLQAADPALAARAVDLLARLMVRTDRLEDAAHYYRIVGRDFAKVAIRDGKTGGDIFNDIATDKRFLPFLGESNPWIGKVKFKEEYGQFAQIQQTYFFEPEGAVPPSLRRDRLSYYLNTAQLKLVDRMTGEEHWTKGLTRQNQQHLQYLNWNQYNPGGTPAVRYPYDVQGHVAVFRLGMAVYGLDLLDRRILWEKTLVPEDAGPITQLIPNPRGGLSVMFPDNRTEPLGTARLLGPDCVLLQTRNGLSALDPIRGTVRWQRRDVPPGAELFGDGEHAFLVDVRDGKVAAMQALRLRDGARVEVPDFSGVYASRIATVGRTLVLAETGPKKELTLRHYDVLTGKDLWKKEFPAGTVALRSEAAGFVGVAVPPQPTEKQARIVVVDLAAQKETLDVKVDAKAIDQARSITLLADRQRFYVAVQGAANAKVNPWGGPWPNLVNGSPGLPVSGRFFAFDRTCDRSKPIDRENTPRDWFVDLEDQVLVMDSYRELPILLFTARAQVMLNGGVFQIVRTTSVEKRSGKIVYDKKMQNNNTNFHTLSINRKAGTIDLIGYNLKIQHYIER